MYSSKVSRCFSFLPIYNLRCLICCSIWMFSVYNMLGLSRCIVIISDGSYVFFIASFESTVILAHVFQRAGLEF